MNTDTSSLSTVLLNSLAEQGDSRTEAYVVVDYTLRFCYLNAQAEKFYGRTRDQLVGRKVEEVFPAQMKFGPFITAFKHVSQRAGFELTYKSPFTNLWVKLIGTPYDAYYSFAYWPIDEKTSLREELRAQVRRTSS